MTPETAATWLEQTAQNSGLVFDPVALPEAAQQLAETVQRDLDGKLAYVGAPPFRIVAGDVVDVPVEEHVATLFLKHARPIAAPASTLAAPTDKPAKPEINTPIAAFGRALAAQHAAAMAKEAETWPNPWAKGQENRTRQNIIRNHHPALAARHKAQAGA